MKSFAVFQSQILADNKSRYCAQRLNLAHLVLILAILIFPLSTSALDVSVSGLPGPFTIGVIDNLELIDTDRQRVVPLKIYYPGGKGPHSVIIYSHGLGGSKNTKVYLARFLTSHGYVCIHLTHDGSDSSLLDHSSSWKQNLKRLKQAVANRKHLVDRPLDISLVIDHIEEIERQAPILKGKIDKEHIGITGHSFGAFTTLMVAGAYANLSKTIFGRRFDDHRPIAFLAMSPQGVRPGLDPIKVFSEVKRPFMTMTGSRDLSPADKVLRPEDRLTAFRSMPEGDKYSLWLEDATHNTFGDARTMKFSDDVRINRPDPEHHRIIKTVHLAFWNAYLRNDKKSAEFLVSGLVKSISGGQASLEFR